MLSLRSLIRPSASIKDPQERARAEVLSGLLIVRGLAITFVMTMFIVEYSPIAYVLAGVATLNFIAFCISRTKYYAIAAIIVIVEPMLFLPTQPIVVTDGFDGPLFAPVWLSLGPMISCLVFRTRTTLIFIALTYVSFGMIWLHSVASATEALCHEALFILTLSTLALIGTYLRNLSDKTLAHERAKLLHTSKLSSLGEMAAGIAHELNSPLAAIVLGCEMIDELFETPASQEQVRAEAHEIAATAHRMSEIIKGLKHFRVNLKMITASFARPRSGSTTA